MDERFKTFRFFAPLPVSERTTEHVHCAKCFASWVTGGQTSSPASGSGASHDVAGQSSIPMAGSHQSPDAAPQTVGSASAFVKELSQLAQLHQQGVLDADEFRRAKRLLLQMGP
jgi:hypothetical protein